MSLARGKFGIEYNPRQAERPSSGLGWVVAVIALIALVSLGWTLFNRFRAHKEEAVAPPVAPPAAVKAEEPPSKAVLPEVAAPPPILARTDYSKRPAKVRNLLLRLEEAERSRDVEMAVNTIETLRALPGSPAADIDDALARRLGALNVRRLFGRRNAQWVKQVTIKRGDSAGRIAAENGSSLASLTRLNGGDIERLAIGSRLYVMNHPRFNLVIRRRSRTADLSLNGKFFKRYDLQDVIGAKDGVYQMSEGKRSFWAKFGIRLKPEDREELETLLPTGASVTISEM